MEVYELQLQGKYLEAVELIQFLFIISLQVILKFLNFFVYFTSADYPLYSLGNLWKPSLMKNYSFVTAVPI